MSNGQQPKDLTVSFLQVMRINIPTDENKIIRILRKKTEESSATAVMRPPPSVTIDLSNSPTEVVEETAGSSSMDTLHKFISEIKLRYDG